MAPEDVSSAGPYHNSTLWEEGAARGFIVKVFLEIHPIDKLDI
ncbi:hypothetical protein ASZ90_002355 [hydrocarbon metagenome]|uniref:Uncharacterized protein n=1 Tax=hydrocarbon metagenome TaxID=938273 RepID=A0A0W8G413_9ZZZZ